MEVEDKKVLSLIAKCAKFHYLVKQLEALNNPNVDRILKVVKAVPDEP